MKVNQKQLYQTLCAIMFTKINELMNRNRVIKRSNLLNFFLVLYNTCDISVFFLSFRSSQMRRNLIHNTAFRYSVYQIFYLKGKTRKMAALFSMDIFLRISLICSAIVTIHSIDDYYGSPLVADAYCSDRERYIEAFTMPENMTTIQGRPEEVAELLAEYPSKGKTLSV